MAPPSQPCTQPRSPTTATSLTNGLDSGRQLLEVSVLVPSLPKDGFGYQSHGVTKNSGPDSSSTIGEFPLKCALMYHHFAKLYLFSHVFRGLGANEPIPGPLEEAATGAVASATNLVELVLADPNLRDDGLRGMPTYLHAMTCFACVFLLKIAAKRGADGLVEVGAVASLASRLVAQFRGAQVTKWHLAHLVADGLERSAVVLLGGRGGGGGEAVEGMGQGGRGGIVGGGQLDPGAAETVLRMPFGLYADPSPSTALHGPTSAVGGGYSQMPSSLQSPDLNFGAQGFFDFNASQSGGDDRLDFL